MTSGTLNNVYWNHKSAPALKCPLITYQVVLRVHLLLQTRVFGFPHLATRPTRLYLERSRVIIQHTSRSRVHIHQHAPSKQQHHRLARVLDLLLHNHSPSSRSSVDPRPIEAIIYQRVTTKRETAILIRVIYLIKSSSPTRACSVPMV
jgi:hypothetical protein